MPATTADLLRKPALELAQMVRDGEVSARELTQASLDRIEATEPLNHWTLVDAEGALAAADAIEPGDERPFAGVPLGLKDLFLPVKGMRLTQGSDITPDFVPDYDSAVARRFREAGFVFMGRTQSPEFGILPVTEPRRFGPCRNPWDAERTTGGSSGGSGGAVAAGAVPVAHASDGGGSIRIPAACNGLVGLKPSRGRISRAPDLGDHMLSTDGVLTRTVADSAALLDLLAGYETGDATWATPPETSFAEQAGPRAGQAADRADASTCRWSPSWIPSTSRPRATPRSCWRSSATTSRRWTRRGRAWTCCPRSRCCGPPTCRSAPRSAACWAAASPAPTPWSRCRCGCTRPAATSPRPTTCWPSASCTPSRAASIGFFDNWDVLITPSLAKLPGAPRRDRPDGRQPRVRVQEVG